MSLSLPHSFYINASLAFLLYASGRFYTERVRIVGAALYLILGQRLGTAARVSDASLYAVEVEHYLSTANQIDVVAVLDAPQVGVGIVEGGEVVPSAVILTPFPLSSVSESQRVSVRPPIDWART